MLHPDEFFRRALILDFETQGLRRLEPMECFAWKPGAMDAFHATWPLPISDLGLVESGAYEMHTASGLIELCLASGGWEYLVTQDGKPVMPAGESVPSWGMVPMEAPDWDFIETTVNRRGKRDAVKARGGLEKYLQRVGEQVESVEPGKLPILCGYSPHFDLRVLSGLGLDGYVCHRVLDLGTISRMLGFDKLPCIHRAWSDVRNCIHTYHLVWDYMERAVQSEALAGSIIGPDGTPEVDRIVDSVMRSLGDSNGEGSGDA